MNNLGPLGAAALLTAVEVAADTAAKLGDRDSRFFDGNNTLVAYGGYNALAFILQRVLPQNNLALTNCYWNAMTNVTHTLVGSLAFGEKLTQQQYLGIGVVTLGIFLLRA